MEKGEKERRLDDFESWITFLPDKINDLKKKLPTEIFKELDFTDKSLILLEKYLLSEFTYDDLIKEENKEFIDCLAAYIGKTFRKNWGNSYWDIELDDEQELYFGVPVIKFKDIQLPAVSPYHTITTALDRKKGNLMSLVLNRTSERLKKII